MLSRAHGHYSGLRHAFDEILDAAETRLFEWRKQTLAGEGQRIDLDESIRRWRLRLAKQEARKRGRTTGRRNKLAKKKQNESDRDDEEEQEEDDDAVPSQLTADERVNLGELEDAIDQLPDEMGLVLMAEAQRVMAGGAPLHEQLGITPEAARKRLERARKELKETTARKTRGSEMSTSKAWTSQRRDHELPERDARARGTRCVRGASQRMRGVPAGAGGAEGAVRPGERGSGGEAEADHRGAGRALREDGGGGARAKALARSSLGDRASRGSRDGSRGGGGDLGGGGAAAGADGGRAQAAAESSRRARDWRLRWRGRF